MVRFAVTSGDLLWAGLEWKDQVPFRGLLRAHDETFTKPDIMRLYGALGLEWDEDVEVPPTYLAADETVLATWYDTLTAAWDDIGRLWSQRNIQGLGVALRAQAEHIGLGSLAFGRTYHINGAGLPDVVVGPPAEDRLAWSRRRIRWLLTELTPDPYDGLTVLEGFAHPSRFSMQAYMDRSLSETSVISVGRHNIAKGAPYLGLVAQRLVRVSALLAAEARHHAAQS